MAFVQDSRYPGYLGPFPSPQPLEADPWVNFLHDLIAGVTGMPGDKVFPRWQEEPPVRPPHNVDWAAVGISEIAADWQAYVKHFPSSDAHPEGYDALQQMETNTVLTSFYGPNATRNAVYLRAGLFISQNQAVLRKAQVGLIEVRNFINAPELFKQKWVDRVDVPVILVRQIRFDYPVLNLIAANGMVSGNAPHERRVIESGFDTLSLPTSWDEDTVWDTNTIWDG